MCGLQDPSAFDFLSQHGGGKHGPGGTSAAAVLARESLYRKFDPLIQGRQSIMPPKDQRESVAGGDHEDNLIAMNSPSPRRPSQDSSVHRRKSSAKTTEDTSAAAASASSNCDSNNFKNNNSSNNTNDNGVDGTCFMPHAQTSNSSITLIYRKQVLGHQAKMKL